MLFEYYYSQENASQARKTLIGKLDYTHCITHGKVYECEEDDLPEDAVLVAIEDVGCISTEGRYTHKEGLS